MKNSNFQSIIIATVAIAAALFMMFFSNIYISEHVSHHCEDSNHCPVCSILEQCENALKTFGTGLIVAAVVLFIHKLLIEAFQGYSFESIQATLISQKVRLDS
ncbi:hypothetical protein [Pseudobutyrivibrio ruminis]|uniref:hypothetical protein n=1 Tax=Pseudobutyrivibrio ruminis TaxID=46206 RepID=UPI00051B4DDD|nr:hypothetical protein [Pseudobutyrivibrio ruminis]